MPADPVEPGAINLAHPVFVYPVFVKASGADAITHAEKANKRQIFLGHIMEKQEHRVVKCLSRMCTDVDELPCAFPTTPSTTTKKRQWEDEAYGFRKSLRTLFRYIQETPHVLSLVTAQMAKDEQSAESGS